MRTVFLVMASLFVAAFLFLFGIILAGWGVWLVGDIVRGIYHPSIPNWAQALGLLLVGLVMMLGSLVLPAVAFWAPSLIGQAALLLHHTTKPVDTDPTPAYVRSLQQMVAAKPALVEPAKVMAAGLIEAKTGGAP